ncbi:hypothetical protein [Microbacterium flavescens]|uniref:hypothetical protein n=1 Tax=Microbacterium flavescens TaxID=69366 RepID=UPI001BDE779D|nr:hypothetical protein [Microbacterium flavescens]BFF12248.1 hypothetical protein GCM10025699_35510 [Microbacterium flavescens]
MSLHKSHTCGKIRFRDHREAVTALHSVATLRKRAEEEMLPTRRREVRTYECDACHGYHLTSMAA